MLKKITKFLLIFIFPLCCLFVLVISYFALCKLVFPIDLKNNDGRLQSTVARQIRLSLLKRKEVKTVSFKTSDGLKLSGLLIKKTKAKANLLVCHGYQSCKEFVSDFVDMFPDYNILLFDFRAHGQSQGKLRTLGCHEYKDVIAAIEFLRASTKINKSMPNQLPLIILGFSMGGSIALRALQGEPNICDVLILDSAFSNLNDVIYNAFTLKSGGLPNFPFVPVIKKMVNFLASCKVDDMQPIDALKNFKKPIFFIHSCIDEVVAPNDSLLMYGHCINEKKKLWIGPKCRHGGLRKNFYSQYKRKIFNFLKHALV